MLISMSETQLSIAINKTLDFLKKTYRSIPDEEMYGWYHYLDDPKPGITASSVVLYCFNLVGNPFERTEEVLLYLKRKQVISEKKKIHGGWPVRTTMNFPILESTSWVLRSSALNHALLNNNAPDISAGYDWIINNQNTDYGWGSYLDQPSRTFTTSLALLALSSLNKYSKELSLGADWLLKNQSADVPAWGAIPESQPTLLHTCWALLALSEIPNKLNRKSLSSSLEWVEKNVIANSLTEVSSQAEDYDIPFVDDNKSMVFQCSLPHFYLPIATYTLLKLSKDTVSNKAIQSVKTILNHQTDEGIWELPRSPMRPSIWAIWPFLSALHQAREIVLLRNNMELNLFSNNVVIVKSKNSSNSLLRIFLSSLKVSVKNFIKKNYGWLILILFIISGLIFVKYNLITWKEFLLAQIFPVILLIIQFILNKKK
ncbi:MAG: hypothetical protein GF353_11270 [Candidatus Lokiarchaeota archaeon]|nr:hypothetical protein [Candidatus Lokiarchaeota archaeon]